MAIAADPLVEIYRAAYLEIITRIATKELTAKPADFERAMLAEIAQILEALGAETQRWLDTRMPEVYRQGQLAIADELAADGVRTASIATSFAGVHQTAVAVLAQQLGDDLVAARAEVGRRVRDLFRDAGLEAVARKVTTGQTWREATTALRRQLATQGIAAFTDSRGRAWRLDTYAEMAIRTTTREATNLGRVNQLTEWGYDLVRMTEHQPTCAICAVYQGRVYSVSGQDPRFPALYETAFRHGYHTIHPRCGHSVHPFVEALATPEELAAAIEASGRPFDVDPRTERQRRAYLDAQQRKREARERLRKRQAALLAGGGGGSGGGGRKPGPPDDADERRRRRERQLAAMSDAEFAAEVRAHQQSHWREGFLRRHAEAHARHYRREFGITPSAEDVRALSGSLIAGWNRLFTGIQVGQISYVFMGPYPGHGGIIVTVTRGGLIRTTFPVSDLAMWFARFPEMIEVTERARRLGLDD